MINMSIFNRKFIGIIVLGVFVSVKSPAERVINRKLPIASEAIIFEQNFDDKSAFPEMAVGKAKPVAVIGKLSFKNGIKGWALACGAGGSKIRYMMKSNLDFDNPGTITFWFRPINWRNASRKHPRVFFWGLEYSKSFVGLQVANGPRYLNISERKIRILLLYFKDIPRTTLEVAGIQPKGDNKWHMLAFTWSKGKISLSLDGVPFAVKTMNGNFKNKLFKGCSFSIGSESGAQYLLDTFRIYNRTLTERELKEIYNTK
jgi:hypothetical protein